jgi:hypothetical protein
MLVVLHVEHDSCSLVALDQMHGAMLQSLLDGRDSSSFQLG